MWETEMKGFAFPPTKVAALVLSGTKPAGSLWGVSSKTVKRSMAFDQRPLLV